VEEEQQPLQKEVVIKQVELRIIVGLLVLVHHLLYLQEQTLDASVVVEMTVGLELMTTVITKMCVCQHMGVATVTVGKALAPVITVANMQHVVP
jgi:hypothetical protein